jgi:hypothetical protein
LKDVTDDIYDFINARIKLYDDWKYPGMIIRPGRESFIDQMVGCDRLYLVDQSYDLLQPAQDRFGQSYRNRLRTFVMCEKRDNGILQDLPDGQFGLVVAYNFFNFRPMEIIEKSADEMTISFTVYDTPELKARILSYGSKARVLAPESLKNAIQQEIANMKEVY